MERMEFDEKGNMWFGAYGVNTYAPNTGNGRVFTEDDGILGKYYKIRSMHKTYDGELIFGCEQGIFTLNPNDLDNTRMEVLPSARIVDLEINNRTIAWGKNGQFEQSIIHTNQLRLNADQKTMKLFFSAMYYDSPQNNRYKYKLEGVDEDWVYTTGKQPYAIYSNLPSGRHLFTVYAANSSGYWSEQPTLLEIVVVPPFWWSWYARAGYALMGIMAFFLYGKYKKHKQIKENDLILDQLKQEEHHRLQKMKLQLFTHITHDMKTPLSLILDPINELIYKKEFQSKTVSDLQIIRKNAIKLQKLVLELMDFQQFESSQVQLYPQRVQIKTFILQIMHLFDYLADQNKVTFTFHSNHPNIELYIDVKQFEKVVFNLLANAFQFTPNGGTIEVEAEERENEVILYFKDSGIGISPKTQERIFEPYFQQETTGKGSGIGLAVAQLIVSQHQGQITLESREREGSTFIIRIPKSKEHFEEVVPQTAILNRQIQHHAKDYLDLLQRDDETIKSEITKKIDVPAMPHVLLIEDDLDIRSYLAGKLAESYEIHTVCNGAEALTHIQHNAVDLIISDLMMPEMDGLDFCKRIKDNHQFSHIPIIVLSAKDDTQTQLDIYGLGIEAFMSKPFSSEVLSARIENLLKGHENQLGGKNSDEVFNLELSKSEITAKDELFLENLLKYVEENLSDPEMNVQDLCLGLGISRAQLYRKIKILTGMSANEFVRTIRLKKAAQILKIDGSSVFQAMIQVGLNNPSYFSKTFKAQFGSTPKEYAKQFDAIREAQHQLSSNW
jgi:signal transduction histidine kinase/DNA-binding response OmpR family regulator